MRFNDQKVRYFLCCYHNLSDQPIILRVIRQSDSAIEQEIAPGEQILFSASIDEVASIYRICQAQETLMETFPCAQLRYLPGDDAP